MTAIFRKAIGNKYLLPFVGRPTTVPSMYQFTTAVNVRWHGELNNQEIRVSIEPPAKKLSWPQFDLYGHVSKLESC